MTPRTHPIPATIRRIVSERCGGHCEGCNKQPATHLHHRKHTDHGGTNEAGNILALCDGTSDQPDPHAGCHGVAHSAEGHELGWTVRATDNPLHVPALYRGTLKWLTNDGRTVDVGGEPNF